MAELVSAANMDIKSLEFKADGLEHSASPDEEGGGGASAW